MPTHNPLYDEGVREVHGGVWKEIWRYDGAENGVKG
jgi:hypothetical protein